MSATTPGIAMMLKQALQLKLLHSRSDCLHHLLVCKAAYFVCVAQDFNLMWSLYHTTNRAKRNRNLPYTNVQYCMYQWTLMEGYMYVHIYCPICSLRNSGQHLDIVRPLWHFVQPTKIWVGHLAAYYLIFI